ncbi:hypothetical protein KJ966_27070 [bacterium]|nr:hypothetical protein [bacterium]
MISPFTKFRKSKERKQASTLINQGVNYLQSSFQHKALYLFQQALEIDSEIVSEMLSQEFEKHFKKGDNELALMIGQIILKINTKDYELANKLGNCARKLKKYKEANEFYRQAFRINQNFEIALYNLSASMGRIPKFNNDIKILVDQFANIRDFVLPNYQIDTNYIENIITSINESKEPESEHSVPSKTDKPSYIEVCNHIRQNIKESGKNLSKVKDRTIFEGHIYNLGLFALSKKDSKLALKCFFELKNRKSKIKYLDMVIPLAMYLESPSKSLIQHLMLLLADDKTNRYLNVNLGLMFRKQGNRILSYKYLATTALLLEKTGGVYCRMDLVRLADQEMELGNLKKAFHLYQLVNSEIEDTRVKTNIGQILLYQSRYSEALPIFKELLEKDKSNTEANQKLKEIHDYFLVKGEELFSINKFSVSIPYFEQALAAVRLPETIKKTANVYKQLMDNAKADELFIEYNKIIRESSKEKSEDLRQSYIENGKKFMLNKQFEKAIVLFEKAFEMKVDKDVFVFLAHIYKSLKRTGDLKNLMNRWKEMIKKEGISLEDI